VSEGYFEIALRQHGMLRPLRAAELSDGTLPLSAAGRRLADAAPAAADGVQ
jgi:predicted ATPase